MNPLANDWSIKHRADACAATGRAFAEGENFYTLLFREGEGFRRQDLSEEAWQQRNENMRPFSFWRSTYEPPSDRSSGDVAERERGRAFSPSGHGSRRRERQRLLRPRGDARAEESLKADRKSKMATAGSVLIYEHAKTGDVFIVPDPQLHLDELEPVQTEVASLLQSNALA